MHHHFVIHEPCVPNFHAPRKSNRYFSIAVFPAHHTVLVMDAPIAHNLSRRERQVMDILFRMGQASAQEVMEALPDPPSYSAIRALLSTLEQKGHVVISGKDSRRYLYRPTMTETKAKRSALSNLLHTFFEGRPEKLVASLLDPGDQKLSKEEIARIRSLIDESPPPH